LLAVVSRDRQMSKVHLSFDCGETWPRPPKAFAMQIEDIAWLTRGDSDVILVATQNGLYEYAVARAEDDPVQIVVVSDNASLGFNALAVFTDARDAVNVVVAAQKGLGVYLSVQSGKQGTFVPIGLTNESIRTLAIQKIGSRSFVWAGPSFSGSAEERGLFRWEAASPTPSADDWRSYAQGWDGGSCNAIAFDGGTVYAATHHAGVVKLDSEQAEPAWQAPGRSSGLPTRERSGSIEREFETVTGLAVKPNKSFLLAGGKKGIFSGTEEGVKFENASPGEFGGTVALPPTWLFCSGTHEIEIIEAQDETSGH
jgi:hypothetical protein